MSCLVKICGINSEDAAIAAMSAGADALGYVFFPPSPRHLSLNGAATLTERVPDMKAISISTAADIDSAASKYDGVADFLLFDAKPPKNSNLPGGNAVSFDWTLLTGRSFTSNWMLAGGLDPDNVADAVRISGAPWVDVSSGVEKTKGVKDARKIADFIHAAKGY